LVSIKDNEGRENFGGRDLSKLGNKFKRPFPTKTSQKFSISEKNSEV